MIHRRRAAELDATTDLTRREIGDLMAEEDRHPATPFDESQVRHRGLRAGFDRLVDRPG